MLSAVLVRRQAISGYERDKIAKRQLVPGPGGSK